MKKLLHTLALGILFCLLAADAAALTVTNAGDSGFGSLRQAITDVASGGTIDFDPGVDGQTITLASELTVNKTIIIDASSLSLGVTVSGGGVTRIFDVLAAGNLTLRGLTLSGGNGAGATLNTEGGALHNAGIATIERCTLSGNTSTSNGGAIRNDGVLTLTQSTLSGNSAAAGGAIANFGSGALTMTHCTISANTAATQGGGLNISGVIATINNSIISGNAATTGKDIWSAGPTGGVLRVGANLIGAAAKTPDAPDSGPFANTADPLLAPLANNGGLTQTMALLAYSQAIDGVPASAIVAGLDTDQRGFARSLGGGPDIGAYESGDATFTGDGLTLYARVQAALIGTGAVFEVSTTADFLVVNPLVSTLAGTPEVFGTTDGTRLSSKFQFPSGVAQDSLGNIFIADAGNNVIRMLGTDGVVSTIAGSGIYGMADGPGLNAAFRFPSGIAVGPDGNVYVSDTFNHRICKLTRPPTEGQPWTVARLSGTGTFGFLNGNGSVARFYYPYGLDLDELGNVYVADALNNRIRKIAPDGSTSTFAGSGAEALTDSATPATAAFKTPQGLVIVTKSGVTTVYVADRNNHCIRSISTTSNVTGLVATEVKTMAGTNTAGFADGTGTAARFEEPSSIAADTDGNLYVSDEENHRIRRVTRGGDVTLDGVVSTVAGTGAADFLDGLSTVAEFNAPAGLLRSLDGSVVVADAKNHALRKIAIAPLRVPAIADPLNVDAAGTLISAVLNMDVLGLDSDVRYYFRYRLPDDSTQAIGQSFIQIDLPSVVTNVADNLTPTAARLKGTVNAHNLPTSAVLEYSTDPDMAPPLRVTTLASAGIAEPVGVAITGTVVLVADRTNHRIFKIDAAGAVTTFAGSGVAGFVNGTGAAAQFDHPSGIVAESDVVLADGATTFGQTTVTCANTAGLAPGASISGLNIAAGTTIVTVPSATQFTINIAATGTSTGLTLTAGGANYYVADEYNHCIRKITANGVVSTLSGSGVAGFADGAAGVAKFLFPTGVAVDDGTVYVADSGNHLIRTVATPGGTAGTLAGTGVSGFADGAAAAAQFASPRAVAVNADGGVLVADTGNHVIRVIAEGIVETFSGSTQGFADGLAASAKFDSPSGLAVGADGTTFVSDAGNHRVRAVDENGDVSTLAGSGIAGAVNSPVSGLYPVSTTQFNLPAGIAVDATGRVLVTQQGRVRAIARGTLPTIAWSTVITGNVDTMIFGDIGGLLPGTMYYYRAKGTCLQATVPGAILSLTTVSVPLAVFDGPTSASPAVMNGQTTVIDFGTTPRGTPIARQFTILNPNGRNVTVTAINVPTGYQVTAGGGVNVIQPAGTANDTLTFTVTLLANNGGTAAGNIVINSDAPGLPAFSFPITAVVLDFPTVATHAATVVHGDTATLNATVNPKGSETTVWFQWSLTGQFDGVLTSTLAGASAGFNQPHGIAIDASGNAFVADTKNHRIRRIAPDGTVTNFAGTGVAGFADGPGASAQFDEPVGLCFGPNNTLFVTDSKNHRIRAITPGGEVSTFSGVLGLSGFTDGVVSGARFNTPWGLAIDANGVLYVADRDNHRIRRVATDGSVSTFAGTGVAGTTNGAFGVGQFDRPLGIAVDRAGFVYVTETASHAIRRLTLDGTVSVFAGSQTTPGLVNGTPAAARFSSPTGLGVDISGSLLIADKGNHCVRLIATTSVSGVVSTSVTTFAGLGSAGTEDGLKDVARFDSPISVAATVERGAIVGELTNATIRKLVPTEPLLPAATGLGGTADIPVSLVVTGLVIGETYHYRAVATNARGTNYGTARSVLAGTPFELWQLAKFGAEATNPAIAGPDADPARDGIANRFKYALGIEPLTHTVNGLPVVVVNGAALTLTYNKRLAATDVAYTVEWSSDLTNWSTTGITEQVFPDNGVSQQIIASIPIAPDRIKFLRLTITFLAP